MRVGVVGLGAVGSLFFNRLIHRINPKNEAACKSVNRVFAIVKPQHLEHLGTVAIYDRQHVPLLEVPMNSPPNALALSTGTDKHIDNPLDVVLVAVKSNDTLEVAQQLAAYNIVGKKSLVISIQNGLGNVQVLQESLATENVLHAVTYMGGYNVSPGHVVLGGEGSTILQGADHLSDSHQLHLTRFCALLDDAGLSTEVVNSQDIQSVIWTKLLVNAAINPLASILNGPNASITRGEANHKVTKAIVNEVAAIAQAEGIALKLNGKSPFEYTMDVAHATSANICSMLHDIRRHKATEISAINEMVVYYGQRHRIPTPNNELMVNLIRGLESRKH
ncbi:ketopantoate reductase [Thraustotheca clavata]|uniref:2-dehydropantoate 2-reductase n=1 Tax=Thraustotheca clavata TaxID=74557 RepID=A0A1W0A470_9STRA|nr:ketopantoate reductase [Thraustotheca clavata]